MIPMIAFERVEKAFAGVRAVDDLSLTVETGELVSPGGRLGLGQEHVAEPENRLIEPTPVGCGSTAPTPPRRPAPLRRRIGYVFQSVGLFPHMTVAENVAVTPSLLGWSRRASPRASTSCSSWCGSTRRRSRAPPAELSGGQRQRVGRPCARRQPASCCSTSRSARSIR